MQRPVGVTDHALRVLMISHTCQHRGLGQMKPLHIAEQGDIELRVLVPDRWNDDYGRWRGADEPLAGRFTLEVGRVRWPHMGPFKRYLHHYKDLRKILKTFQPQVIDLWEESWGMVSAHTCWLRNRYLPKARIISETEQNINKKLPLPFEHFRRYTLRNSDFVIARNAEAVNVVRSKGYQGPAEVVGNAVDVEMFKPMDRSECRGKLNLEGFTAAYIGRFVEEKGMLDIIEAAQRAKPGTLMLFVGEGPMQKAMEARAAELGVTDRVRILPFQPQKDLPSVMNAIDVLLLPSRTTPAWKEQFGRVIIEAHACQTPVIGTASGAIPDVIHEGGLTIPERDPAALADAIELLRNDPARRQAMGEAGRRNVLAKYSWERVAQQMRDIYSRVASRPESGRPQTSETPRKPDVAAA